MSQAYVNYILHIFGASIQTDTPGLGGIVYQLTVDKKNKLEEVVKTSKKTSGVRQLTMQRDNKKC